MSTIKQAADRHLAAFNAKNLDEFVANEDPEIEFILPGGVALRGHDQVRDYMTILWDALPDMKVTATAQVIEGDTAVTESTYFGTHTGVMRTPNGDIPASGNTVTGKQVAVQRIRDGRVYSEHLYFDQLEFLGALGALDRA